MEKIKLDFDTIYNSVNIAEHIDAANLKKIADKVIKGYEDDDATRSEWKIKSEKILEIANQDIKKTNKKDGANVKMPIITTASIQFAARSYPEVIRNGKVVNTLILGKDDNLLKKEKSIRVTDHMNYQLLVEDSQWEESFDRLLHVFPIVGLVYKKVYYNPITRKNCSELCLPDQIIVNNNVKNLTSARRVTHLIPTYYNDIIEKIRHGVYLDVSEKLQNIVSDESDEPDYDKPLLEVEQHCYLDLDGDGYEEPYIVTVEKTSREVLRIYRCFDMDGVEVDENMGIKRIIKNEYFVDFHFIHSPDGSYHSIGFGQLLLPLNEAINTLINQLIDAGTLANMPGGFLGRAFRARKGTLEYTKGEFKQLDISGEDIAKSIYKMPFDEPSQTLFQLLGLLIQQAKELASVTDMLQGNQTGQNMPATTSVTLVEQGLKVFNSLQKRLYRSLKAEFKALFKLNSQYLDQNVYFTVNDDVKAIAREDYDLSTLDIIPVSDPSMSSDAQRMARSQAIMSVMPSLTPAGQQEALRNFFDSLNTPAAQIQALLPPPDPNAPPPPEVQKLMAETTTERMKPHLDQLNAQLDQAKIEVQNKEVEVKMILARAELTKAQSQAELYEAQAVAALAEIEDSRKIKVLENMLNAMSKGENAIAKETIKEITEELELETPKAEDEEDEQTSNEGGIPPMETESDDTMVSGGSGETEEGEPGIPS